MTLYAIVMYTDNVKGDTLAIYTEKSKADTWIYYNSDHDEVSYDIEQFEADKDPEMDQ